MSLPRLKKSLPFRYFTHARCSTFHLWLLRRNGTRSSESSWRRSGDKVDVEIENLGFLKDTPLNLLALSPLVEKGAIVHLEKGNCYLRVRKRDGSGYNHVPMEERGGLYIVRLEHYVGPEMIKRAYHAHKKLNLPDLYAPFDGKICAPAASINLWHRRLNHMSPKSIKIMYDHGSIEGMEMKGGKFKHDKHCKCTTCEMTRAHAQPTPNQRRFHPNYQRPWAQVQSDLKGPLHRGFGSYRFSLTFIDEASRESYIYFLRSKNETHLRFQDFLNDLRAAGNAPPLVIRTDGGSEYYHSQACNQAGEHTELSRFSKICRAYGIQHKVAPPGKSSLNGIVERHHRTIHEAANAYLHEARLSPIFWPYACKHSVWVKNRISHRMLGPTLTPHEIVHRRRPRYDRLRVFGCDMYEFVNQAKVPGAHKARRLIYLGVPDHSDSGFLGYDPVTNTVRLVFDVTFDENFLHHRQSDLRNYDKARSTKETEDGHPEFVTRDDKLIQDQIRTLFQSQPLNTDDKTLDQYTNAIPSQFEPELIQNARTAKPTGTRGGGSQPQSQNYSEENSQPDSDKSKSQQPIDAKKLKRAASDYVGKVIHTHFGPSHGWCEGKITSVDTNIDKPSEILYHVKIS